MKSEKDVFLFSLSESFGGKNVYVDFALII
jgi:hypothetical protein